MIIITPMRHGEQRDFLQERNAAGLPGLNSLTTAFGKPGVAAPGPPTARNWFVYALSVVVAGLVAVGLGALRATPGTLAITTAFLLTVVLIAGLWGGGPAIVASVTGAAVLNYLIVPPSTSFSVPTLKEILRLIGLLAVALAVGTYKDRNLQVERQAREVAEREQFQKTLLEAISHDLKTPVTAIVGSLNVLLSQRRQLADGDPEELLGIAHEQAKRLDRLITGVLEMTRLDAAARYLHREPGQVRDVIENAIAQLGETLTERECRTEIPAELPSVTMDTVLLSHALMNILDNAAKFSAPDAPIDVAVCASEGHVLVTVADRGVGVPAAELVHIFEKFYRTVRPDAPGSARRGSGLGLAIAKSIVEAHGGEIWAEQRPQGGTIIKMSLPVNAR